MRNAVLASKVEGATTIIKIVPEGSTVKAGDLVVELDSSILKDKETQQEVIAERAKTALDQGREDLKLQEIQNKSDTEAAELRLKIATIDLKKFQEGDLVQQKNELLSQKKLAEETLARAEESYDYIKRMTRIGYKSQNDLESERVAVETQRINKELVQGKIKLLSEFTEERTLIELVAKVEECKRDIERTESRTRSALIQKQAELHARELTYEVEHSKHERYLAQIEACKIYATQDGQVVYANTRDGRAQDQVMIDEGVAVRERQAIINIPDLDLMKVNARIHESRISMVRPGMTVIVRVDAAPNQTFNGIVDSVASVPSSTGGFSSSIKEYEAVIKLVDEKERINKLRPGLNASAEILVERREDVLQIPIQANVTIGSKQYVFVVLGKNVEERQIKVGKTNSNFIEILEGVEEGEEVVMNPQSHFQKDISDIEERLLKEQPKETAKLPEVLPPASQGDRRPGEGGPSAAAPGDGAVGPGGDGRRRRPEGEGQPAGGSTEGRPGGGNFDPMARFNSMDKDQDGKVSKAEAADTRFAERFDSVDTDADGSVTKDEFMAGVAKMGRGGGRGGRPPAEAGGN